jgi:hypothetical protein
VQVINYVLEPFPWLLMTVCIVAALFMIVGSAYIAKPA